MAELSAKAKATVMVTVVPLSTIEFAGLAVGEGSLGCTDNIYARTRKERTGIAFRITRRNKVTGFQILHKTRPGHDAISAHQTPTRRRNLAGHSPFRSTRSPEFSECPSHAHTLLFLFSNSAFVYRNMATVGCLRRGLACAKMMGCNVVSDVPV
ncbi:hypothetical protein BV25DRAFT_1824213 [Artomyces pyxidatus]|uniref:Uncharacterized protein n=1 Tax=Artomyces pyxidatus TaxID=48021 RepID=A0ACB8T528_9AGAM|nr:hypothetical protein BV25DRAFT_1824213 [Artomyces pyxidatus]